MFRKLLLICLLAVSVFPALAQYKAMGRVGSVNAGTAVLNEELDNVRYGSDFSMGFAYPLCDRVQSEMSAGMTTVKVPGFSLQLVPIDWRLRWSVYPMNNITPYITGGVGMVFYDGNHNLYFPYGAGVEVRLADDLYLDLKGTANYAKTGATRRIYDEDDQDWQVYTVGLRFPIFCDNKPVVKKPVPAPAPKVTAPEIGKKIRLEGIVFKTASSEIQPEAEKTLNEAFATLNDNPQIEVEINGYTDNVGGRESNMKLSQDRANSVKEWLVKKGIASTRITARGFGPDSPVATNDTPEGRQQNRRIEFVRVK